LFLEASAVNTQFTFGGFAEASTNLGPNVAEVYGVGGRVTVEEKPTVTYTPLQGGDFVERVLSPIRLETLLLLDGSGWSSERIFRACLQQMNGVKNAPAVRKVLENSRKVSAVFQGHSHKNEYHEIGGIHYCTLVAMVEGSGKENNGYSTVDVLADGTLRVTGHRKQEKYEWG